jgi:hypothetical protein
MDKTRAAKRLAEALESDLDFEVWLDEHPNSDRAMERLREAVKSESTGDKIAVGKRHKESNGRSS